MKYQYAFTLASATPARREYACGALRARLDFLEENLMRVALYRDSVPLLPTYTVCPGDLDMPREGRPRLSTEGFSLTEPKVSREGALERFSLGEAAIQLNLNNFQLSCRRNGKTLFADRAGLAYNLGGEMGQGVFHYVARQEGERIFGLGDKTGPVDKAGRRYVLSATDAMGYDAALSDPLYKHLPFYICMNSAGSYGVYYDTHAQGEMDLGREINNYYGPYKYFTCQDDALVYYVFWGSVSGIVKSFARLCGRPAFPPKWTLDYCGSTMTYTDAQDADRQLRGFVDKCAAQRIRCGGFYLSSGYTSRDGRRYVFTWNRDKLPDPAALVKYFSDRGMELIANIKPAFLTDHPMYAMIAQNGWFLHYADGSPAVVPFWSGMGSYLDFTHPGAYDFWIRMVNQQLIAYGIGCTWNDNNEYDIADEAVYAHGFGKPVQACRIRPVFPMLMAMASHAAQADGLRRPFLVTRAGCGGLTRLAQTWTGDNHTSFHDLAYNHRQAMTMSLSGLFNFGHDIGGFAGERPGEELFFRWLQYGVFLPRFVIHSWNPDNIPTMPWTYPDRMDAVRALFALRHGLKPYLYDALYRMHADYEPILRPLMLDFPGSDPESECYLCGTDLLAANVFHPGRSWVTAELPANNGGWYCQGQHYPGGQAVTLPSLPDALPVYFCRGGSVVLWDESEYPGNGPEQPVFTVYPLDEGEFTRSYFNDDGLSFAYRDGHCSKITFHVLCQADTVTVAWQNQGDVPIEPDIRLCDRLNRRLVLKRD